MQQIAIDLGGRKSQVCARSSDGEIVEERSCETRSLRAYLRQRPPSRVVIETCAEAFAVADAALELGHQVRVVPATLVRALGVGARGIKNDQRDARLLSEASCRMDLPSVRLVDIKDNGPKQVVNLTPSWTTQIRTVRNCDHGLCFARVTYDTLVQQVHARLAGRFGG